MRTAPSREQTVGIEYYYSDTDGTDGQLRVRPADFQVQELETVDPESVDSPTGDYPHVLLRVTLSEWDTNDFAQRLSNDLEISRERISWAGTKDKHAITTQLFSVARIDPENNALFSIPNADVEVIGRIGRSLQFGDLGGNGFEIHVRNATDTTVVDAITAELHTHAMDSNHSQGEENRDPLSRGADEVSITVPNYFGHQRFGSHRSITHRVGRAVVRGAWREAVLQYVANSFESEPKATQRAREFVDEQAGSANPDWEEAIERMPGALRFERSMLHRLNAADASIESDAETWRHALMAVPENLQQLFINAAQSDLFNRIISERIRQDIPIHRPVVGDIVCFQDQNSPTGVKRADPTRTQLATERRVDIMRQHCERGRAFVTAPLIGTKTDLASNTPGEIEENVLAEYDITPADFDRPGAFNSTGTRRAMALQTDISTKIGVDRAGEDYDDIENYLLEFKLPPGAYATAVLREYLKVNPAKL
ncbi:tRNA pseudouridine(13) synthase TruD [Haloquadratum walsbyi]|uniref:Probable tRNA pseudouridine synthase D n=1 Tax=Haloquadratum walsbyi J07HQW2 TaxID=1238425 RepID=U1NHK2_9EURY|nr:tRNA pseudouridine(13) synthase TruD [Haloquadratum walsbyi]ERG96348.1 MAG: tRNA pseudouridine synthase, TruD family [Haloquadratum walsbyi J07HQW2]